MHRSFHQQCIYTLGLLTVIVAWIMRIGGIVLVLWQIALAFDSFLHAPIGIKDNSPVDGFILGMGLVGAISGLLLQWAGTAVLDRSNRAVQRAQSHRE